MDIFGYGLTDENFGSVDVAQKIFGSRNYFQKVMEVEAALASVQAELGIIPQTAADEINRKCDVNCLDIEEYSRQRALTEHHMVCLLRVYRDACEGDAGEYLHWGATTQDIVDTTVMLQIKQTYEVIGEKLQRVRTMCEALAKEYRSVVMCGRTADQQAIPITLGFKIAGWVDQLDRCIERMDDAKDRIVVGQFFGAVGTLASLGDQGYAVSQNLMRKLGLGIPRMAWYAARDRVVEFACNLAQIAGALGRIGNEVYISQKTEVAELSEEYIHGKVGSSTMPHKRNPVLPSRMVSLGRMAKSMLVEAFETLDSTNERDGRPLYIELCYLPRLCAMVDGALDTAIELLDGLEVHKDNIERNLYVMNGLMMTEPLMMALAGFIGRQQAHEVVYEVAMKALDSKIPFNELIVKEPTVLKYLSLEQIEALLDPHGYTGLSAFFVDQVAGV